MHVSVRNVFKRKLFAAGSKVALLVPVTLQVAVDRAHHSERSDVELSTLVKEWFLDVLLHDVRPLVAVHVRVLDEALDVVQFLAHLDATPSVRVFSWLDDPNVAPLLRVVV